MHIIHDNSFIVSTKVIMSGFLMWKYISFDDVARLESTVDESQLRLLLHEIFLLSSMEQKKQKIAVNFHLYNYAFCKAQAFDALRTSTFLSIMTEIFLIDQKEKSIVNSSEKSFDRFNCLILKHGIERPPHSLQIFRKSDIEPIINYAVERYFKRYSLYSYIFGAQTQVVIQQVTPHDIEFPKLALPLSESVESIIMN